jgi:hypothetical protein
MCEIFLTDDAVQVGASFVFPPAVANEVFTPMSFTPLCTLYITKNTVKTPLNLVT